MKRVVDASAAVLAAKIYLNINHDNLSDNEISKVCKYLARNAPDTHSRINGPLEYGPIGIGVMLFITLSEFPDFYRRHELWLLN